GESGIGAQGKGGGGEQGSQGFHRASLLRAVQVVYGVKITRRSLIQPESNGRHDSAACGAV
ncbi:hypothetical protein QWI17_16725, partial [Gilvimarinus sp. SDUM040013]|uniref:hypothetical protein n=1 Tax=Gilvimarinus gilvus TaxID=3058038 RepID=UPI002673DA13